MTPFRPNRVLVVTGGGDDTGALQTAVSLAGDDSDIVVLAVQPEARSWWQRLLPGDVDVAGGLVEAGRRRLDDLVAATGLTTHSRVRLRVATGPEVDTALDVAVEEGADVVVRSPGPTSTDTPGVDATTMRLVRSCPVPVWLHRTPGRGGVLVAVDPDPEDPDDPGDALDADLVATGVGLAAERGVDLHVVHGWELEGEGTLRHSAYVHLDDAQVDRLADEVEDQHTRAVTALVDRADTGDVDVHLHVLRCNGAAAVRRVERAVTPSVAVLGTHQRSGLRALVLGNTAEELIPALGCSVLTMRPEPG